MRSCDACSHLACSHLWLCVYGGEHRKQEGSLRTGKNSRWSDNDDNSFASLPQLIWMITFIIFQQPENEPTAEIRMGGHSYLQYVISEVQGSSENTRNNIRSWRPHKRHKHNECYVYKTLCDQTGLWMWPFYLYGSANRFQSNQWIREGWRRYM